MYWRQIGGHLRKVETCTAGVTWGIGFDGRGWAYTGGWGGGCLAGQSYTHTHKDKENTKIVMSAYK
jgi:tectonin beta-propeller repeat-containing protein 1